MLVYRISHTKWAHDLSGEGARLNGGRWNRIGIPCLYTASSRSLAILEYSVNTGLDLIPRALSLVTIEVPDRFRKVATEELPGNWKDHPAPSSVRAFGTSLLLEAKHLIIRVPSTVIPEEFNYIINPLHLQAGQCRIRDMQDHVYDVRIKRQ